MATRLMAAIVVALGLSGCQFLDKADPPAASHAKDLGLDAFSTRTAAAAPDAGSDVRVKDSASADQVSGLCGDGVCAANETTQTCPTDCPLNPGSGQDGCSASATPGCGGCACESCVCQADAYCCQTAWDNQCVQECDKDCGATCAGPSTDGCTASTTPGCQGCACESCVCATDAYCCQTAWDAQCVTECKQCGSCGAAVGCGDGICQAGETAATCPADCDVLVTCLNAKCGAPWQACSASQGCWNLLVCQGLCGANATCAQKCLTKASAADKAALTALQQCATTSCGSGTSQGCTPEQNSCNGTLLTYCDVPSGTFKTLQCSDADCAASGAGKLLGCGKNAQGISKCICVTNPNGGGDQAVIDAVHSALLQCPAVNKFTIPTTWQAVMLGETGCLLWIPPGWSGGFDGTSYQYASDAQKTSAYSVLVGWLPGTGWNEVTQADWLLNELKKQYPDLHTLEAGTVADPFGLGIKIHNVLFRFTHGGVDTVGTLRVIFGGCSPILDACKLTLNGSWTPVAAISQQACVLLQVDASAKCPSSGAAECNEVECTNSCKAQGNDHGYCSVDTCICVD